MSTGICKSTGKCVPSSTSNNTSVPVSGSTSSSTSSISAADVAATLAVDSTFQTAVKGAKGDKGDTGPAGAAGPQGPQGLQGPAGASPTVADVAATLAADSTFQTAVAVDSTFQTAVKAALAADSTFQTAVTGPQGPQGLQGPAGASPTAAAVAADGALKTAVKDALAVDSTFQTAVKGAKGDKGDTGAAGVDGTSPTAADVAAESVLQTAVKAALAADSTFQVAVTGPQGLQGPAGVSPTAAAVKDALAADSTFQTAVTGPQGPQGLQGPAGADGTSPTAAAVAAESVLQTAVKAALASDTTIFIPNVASALTVVAGNSLPGWVANDQIIKKFGSGQILNSPTETNCIDNNSSTHCGISSNINNLFGTPLEVGQYIRIAPAVMPIYANYPYQINLYDCYNTITSTHYIKINQIDNDYIIVEKTGGAKELISFNSLITPSTVGSINVTSSGPLITHNIFNVKFGIGQVGALNTSTTLYNFLGIDISSNTGYYVKLSANTDAADKATYPYLIGLYDGSNVLQTTPPQTKVKPLVVNANYLVVDNLEDSPPQTILGFKNNLSSCIGAVTPTSSCDIQKAVDHFSFAGITLSPTVTNLFNCGFKFGQGQIANNPTEANCTDNNTSTVCALNAAVGNLFGVDMTAGQYIQFTPNIDADSSTYPYTITHYSNTNTVISSTNVKINQMDNDYMIIETCGGDKTLVAHKAAISDPATVNITLDPDGSITPIEINARVAGSTTAPQDLALPFKLFDLKFGHGQVKYVESATAQTAIAYCTANSCCESEFGLKDWGVIIDAYVQFSVNTNSNTNSTYPYRINEYDATGTLLSYTRPVKFTHAGSDFIVAQDNDTTDNYNIFSLKSLIQNTVSGFDIIGTPSPTASQINTYAAGGSTTPLIIDHIYTLKFGIGQVADATCVQADCSAGSIHSGPVISNLLGTTLSAGQYVKLSANTDATDKATYPYLIGKYLISDNSLVGTTTKVKPLAVNSDYLLLDDSSNSDSKAILLGFKALLGTGGVNINLMTPNYNDIAEVDHWSLDGVFF